METNKNLIEKARKVKSVDELITLAKDNGVELPLEEANKIFSEIKEYGEIKDDDLDKVSGGGCYRHDGYLYTTIGYGCEHYEERGSFGVAGTCCRCKYWDYSKVSQVVIIGQPMVCMCEANRRKQDGWGY